MPKTNTKRRHTAKKRTIKRKIQKKSNKKKITLHSLGIKKKTEQKGHSHEALKFPRWFLWGTSTSAHQVEGNNMNNDWWVWEQKKGTVKNNDRSGDACDHYNRYEDDFDWSAKLNHNAHRLSIEWSRIEPEEGVWSWDEIDHYREVLKALQKRKIKVMLTLHHFTNPIWLAKKGGWTNSQTPALFARYAEFVAEHLGEYVFGWITINEPMIYLSQSYVVAVWPPQDRSYFKAFRVFRNMVKGHRLAYKEIQAEMKKQNRQARVGIAQNMVSLVSYKNKFLDWVYVRISELVWNELFLNKTKQYHDFIGVNYYLHQRVRRGEGGGFIFVDVRKEHRESSDLGWEVFAPGLFDVLVDLQKYKKPIYITENGIATVNDDKRTRFIVAHLKEVYHAIQSGVDIRGYFYWSLLDNFEWQLGFEPRFGLVEVDYGTQKRKPRPSAYVYAEIARDNEINHGLMRFLGHGVTLNDICVVHDEFCSVD